MSPATPLVTVDRFGCSDASSSPAGGTMLITKLINCGQALRCDTGLPTRTGQHLQQGVSGVMGSTAAHLRANSRDLYRSKYSPKTRVSSKRPNVVGRG